MSDSINIVAGTSYSLQVNDKKQIKKIKLRAYRQRPEVKAKIQEYNQRWETKVKKQEYEKRPEVKARIREYKKKWYQAKKTKIEESRQTSEVKTKKQEYFQKLETKARLREYRQRPEVKAKSREYQQRPEVKTKKQEYFQKLETKARLREYRQRLEVKAKSREYQQRPEVKTKKQKYLQRPEVKARIKEYKKKWYQIRKTIKLKDNVIKSKKETKIINQIDDEQMIDNLLLTDLEVEPISGECLLFDFDEIEQMTNSSLTNLEVGQDNSQYLQISNEINNEQMINDLLTKEEIAVVNQLLVTNNYSLTSQGG